MGQVDSRELLVLVVAGDRAQRAHWSSRINGLGYATREASSALEARAALDEQNVSLILAHSARLEQASDLLERSVQDRPDVPDFNVDLSDLSTQSFASREVAFSTLKQEGFGMVAAWDPATATGLEWHVTSKLASVSNENFLICVDEARFSSGVGN